MTARLSDHFSIFGLVFFVLKSLLGIARQGSREKFAILSLKPQPQNTQKCPSKVVIIHSKYFRNSDWLKAHV